MHAAIVYRLFGKCLESLFSWNCRSWQFCCEIPQGQRQHKQDQQSNAYFIRYCLSNWMCELCALSSVTAVLTWKRNGYLNRQFSDYFYLDGPIPRPLFQLKKRINRRSKFYFYILLFSKRIQITQNNYIDQFCVFRALDSRPTQNKCATTLLGFEPRVAN